MLVGNSSIFAIESSITQAYENPSLRALGYFAIHVAGRVYGVRSPNASMLACSFDTVQRRLDQRGHHYFPGASKASAVTLAEAVHSAIYSENIAGDYILGVSTAEFTQLLHASEILWAPDGDEAFDDGGHVLQLDEESGVRIVAFTNSNNIDIISDSLSELFMPSIQFYETLNKWKIEF